jgi:hypothetical protein
MLRQHRQLNQFLTPPPILACISGPARGSKVNTSTRAAASMPHFGRTGDPNIGVRRLKDKVKTWRAL